MWGKNIPYSITIKIFLICSKLFYLINNLVCLVSVFYTTVSDHLIPDVIQ